MKVYTREVTESRRFIEIDGEEFRVHAVLEILDELEEADGAFNRLVIYNSKLADVLEKRNVIFKNIRGSCGRSDNYKEFCDEVERLVG